ncbi:unnamed protein product [Rhodiola kirilowii]
MPPYHPTAKPSSNRRTLFTLILIAILCIISYSLGSFQTQNPLPSINTKSATSIQRARLLSSMHYSPPPPGKPPLPPPLQKQLKHSTSPPTTAAKKHSPTQSDQP